MNKLKLGDVLEKSLYQLFCAQMYVSNYFRWVNNNWNLKTFFVDVYKRQRLVVLEIGIDLKLMGGDLGEIPGTMEQRLSLCSRGNS